MIMQQGLVSSIDLCSLAIDGAFFSNAELKYRHQNAWQSTRGTEAGRLLTAVITATQADLPSALQPVS